MLLDDPVHQRPRLHALSLLEEVLATEEEHAEDLVSFIEEIEKWPPRYGGRQTTA